MIAWLTGEMTTQRLVTSLHAVAHATELTVVASVKTDTVCSPRAKQISAFRPTTSLEPLRAGMKMS